MLKETIKFSLRLLLGLAIVLIAHLAIHFLMDIAITDFLILESYFTNLLLVVISYWIILYFKEKKSQSLGFFYLAGFFLKLTIFFIFFNPTYKADDIIQTGEFFAFFLPYALCLIYETTVVVRILNKS